MRVAMSLLILGLVFPRAVTEAEDPQSWQFAGLLQAGETAKLQPRVAGVVSHLAVKKGATVAKGDLLLEIDPRMHRLAVELAQARLQSAEAKLEAAKLAVANADKLMHQKVISSQELALQSAAKAEAEAALRIAKVKFEQAQLRLSWTRITAPFDGTVSDIQTSVGSVVAAAQPQVMTIVSTDTLHVYFNVPENILLRLRRDGLADAASMRVALGFDDEKDQPHSATLDLIESVVDSKTGCVRFRATMENEKAIFSPGMSAIVRLTAVSKQ